MPLPVRTPNTLPLTAAEQSDYARTSLHADVMAFIDQLRTQCEQRGDQRLRVSHFGHTPQGRELPLLVLSEQGYFTPQAAHASGLPVVLLMCGIHAGEVEGKEAGLMWVRDLLAGQVQGAGNVLAQLTLVVVPLFNADGNDAISASNRPLDLAHFTGQCGPDSGVGTRNTAAGINLNRDYMRQQALEMRLLQARVAQPWNAHLTIDCHATNGSIHRYALSYDIPHLAQSGRIEPINYMRQHLLPAVQAAVKSSEGLDTFWYGNFLRDEGGQGMGWITYTHHPRFGGNYRGLTNRLDLLLETYSYQSFEDRVLATYAFVRESLLYVAAHGAPIVAMLADCQMPPQEVAIRYRLEAFAGAQVSILTRSPYTLSGAPITVAVPHIGRFVAQGLVLRPWAYAVPGHVGDHLERHGLVVQRHPSAMRSPPRMQVQIATVGETVRTAGRDILEANASSYTQAVYAASLRVLPDGWCIVCTEQQRGAIAVYLCEAESDDGLVACGLIDAPEVGAEFPAWRVLHAVPEHA